MGAGGGGEVVWPPRPASPVLRCCIFLEAALQEQCEYWAVCRVMLGVVQGVGVGGNEAIGEKAVQVMQKNLASRGCDGVG